MGTSEAILCQSPLDPRQNDLGIPLHYQWTHSLTWLLLLPLGHLYHEMLQFWCISLFPPASPSQSFLSLMPSDMAAPTVALPKNPTPLAEASVSMGIWIIAPMSWDIHQDGNHWRVYVLHLTAVEEHQPLPIPVSKLTGLMIRSGMQTSFSPPQDAATPPPIISPVGTRHGQGMLAPGPYALSSCPSCRARPFFFLLLKGDFVFTTLLWFQQFIPGSG